MRAARPAHPQAGRLPSDLTEFVGRRAELARIRKALNGARLITLTGPGGIGKTRLALRATAELTRDALARHRSAADWHGIVLTLVQLGLSNRDIAGTLVISPRTAETHVQHIMGKLGCTARTQIAAWSAGPDGIAGRPGC